MKRFVGAMLALLLVGCGASLSHLRANNASNLLQLTIGMDKREVLRIMGTEIISVYSTEQIRWTGACCPEKIPNPYRTEIMRAGDKSFEVIYYYTDIKKADGAITNDELTPLVFDNGKLIGWGWSFFENTAQKYEIELKER